MKAAAGAPVPVVGVPCFTFFAMEIGVDGHGVLGFQVVNEIVAAGPFAFGIPPKGYQRG